ncbi:MAG: TRAP transporter small permease [Spirochaetaceae bacterium]|nr:TRAP transporter small permease [Spirochaetaceae bacterium]
MKRVFDAFTAVNNFLKKIEMFLGSICLAVLFVVMILNAALRYLFNSGLNYSDELNGFLFVWFGFLAAAYIMAEQGHLNVTAFVGLFSRKIQFVIRIILNVIMVAMIIVYFGPLQRLLKTLPISNVLRWPLRYVYLILPISFTLMGIHIFYNIFRDFHNSKTNFGLEKKDRT